MVQPRQGVDRARPEGRRARAGRRTWRLVADADVFVQNLAHGAAAPGLGLDAATLCAAYPRLVAVDISGYGASGPYADVAGGLRHARAVRGGAGVGDRDTRSGR
ncbi:CoA transferase [Streptomyces sp. L7]